MISTILIALLISLGIITSEADYNNLNEAEKEYYQDIIIYDDCIDI